MLAAKHQNTHKAETLEGEKLATARIRLAGRVQGVGFRPFVYRLARQYGLTGSVQNQLGEVDIFAQGRVDALSAFERALLSDAPPLSQPRIVAVDPLQTGPFTAFEIIPSSGQSEAEISVPPDYFMCADCLAELSDPADRRYRYPFINCTQCGPRYTLIHALPYDRPNTSMADFPLCDECVGEYQDPTDRRFHAEPTACPVCGPQLSFNKSSSETLIGETALAAAVSCLRKGEIVAVKGIGGYHLMCDARSTEAVDKLRQRKQRPHKPLAVMFPVQGEDSLDAVRQAVSPNSSEADLLRSSMRPIVLARKNLTSELAANLAPGLGELGVILPYSPLHHVLLEDFGGPLVATSGNISGEPVLTRRDEAAKRLSAVADAFLDHDRPIVRPADDSVYRQIGKSMVALRLGRGAAPVEITLPWRQSQPVLAVGGHMKANVALSWDNRVVVSPHIGEMDSPRSLAVFEQVAEDLQSLYGIRAQRVVCDAHTGYTSHRWAQKHPLPAELVWHHRAHASALVAEFEARKPEVETESWLVFTWDGVGLGEDGSLWGGEALHGSPGLWRRVSSIRPFKLSGGESAGRQPWRSAAALHWETGRSWSECPDETGLAKDAWERNINCQQTSAMGRLFDAAAALVCGTYETSFEAQGPMQLESLCCGIGKVIPLPMIGDEHGVIRSDWEPLLADLGDAARSPRQRAETFHTSIATVLLDQARRARNTRRVDRVGLSGGVFQNRMLTEQVINLLQANLFDVYLNTDFPCNDGALALGQAAELAAREQGVG